MNNDTHRKAIPDIFFEEYAAGELPESKRKAVESHPDFEDKIKKIKNSNREILSKYPSDKMAEIIQERIRKEETDNNIYQFHLKQKDKKLNKLFPMAGAAVLFLALGITLLVLLAGPEDNDIEAAVPYRIKGGSFSLRIYRQTNGGSEILSKNDTVSEGDRLQAGYISQDYDYGIIASVDGNGNISLHFPAESWYSTKIEKGEQKYLPYSYILDDAPSFERFFFFVSDTPIDVNSILALMENSIKKAKKGSVPVPESVDYLSILLNKEE